MESSRILWDFVLLKSGFDFLSKQQMIILLVMVRRASSMSIMIFAVCEVRIVMAFSQAMLLLSVGILPLVKTGIAPNFHCILFLLSEEAWENKRCIFFLSCQAFREPGQC